MYPSFQPKPVEYSETTGTDLMRDLLIKQYQSSPNLITYFNAFFEEMDLLFTEAQKMYQGRFLEYATGDALDSIGDILGINRAVYIDRVFFGMRDEAAVAAIIAGMADEATPGVGGIFLSEDQDNFDIVPLDDATYRTMLRVKALCMANFYKDINFAYECISILIGRVLADLELKEIAVRSVSLDLETSAVSNDKAQIVQHMSQYFIPAGTLFTINLV